MDNRLLDVTFPPAGFTPNAVNTLLANALDLTAPASDALLKNRKNAWVQLAGHPGSFAPAGPHTIWKKRMQKENNETKAYQALMHDVISDVIPKFYREVEYNGDFFIEIEDLLQHFHDPSIMDIKIGSRTFMESEVKNPVLRKDLYEKMIKLNPDEPTQTEHEERAITKLRYMQFREKGSTTASLGFRIEAIRMRGEKPTSDIKRIRNRDQAISYISKFIHYNSTVRDKFVSRLDHIAKLFEKSPFFKTHELVGSSLLLMHDKEDKAGIWMIDFAKALPAESELTHRAPWVVGNHEDGYLTGVDNLKQVLKEIPAEEPASSTPSTTGDPNININLHQPDVPTSKITANTDKPALSLATSKRAKSDVTPTGSRNTSDGASQIDTSQTHKEVKVENVKSNESVAQKPVNVDTDRKVDNTVKNEQDVETTGVEERTNADFPSGKNHVTSSPTGSLNEDIIDVTSQNTDGNDVTLEDKDNTDVTPEEPEEPEKR